MAIIRSNKLNITRGRVLEKPGENSSETPVSELAEPNGLVDWLHRDKMDMEEVKHLVQM